MKKKELAFFTIFIIFILAIVIILILIYSPGNHLTGNAAREPYSEINIYFCPVDMCMEQMLKEMGKASKIKCAFYELNLPQVITVLKNKKAEVVIEDSTFEEESGFYSGYSNALMHNKFCVLDDETVMTGSMNPTINDNYLNNNNLIILKSRTLAQNYLDEFSELKQNIYGKGGKIKKPIVFIGDIKIENYFCPEDNCKLHVINALKGANSSIYFMVFSFTDEDIGNLVWNKNYQGLDIKGIFDASQLSDYSRYDDLKGVSIVDKNKYKLHHKVFIIDNKTVITGSYNPSKNANQYNDENIMIIYDEATARKYILEFERLFYHEDNIPEFASELILSKVLYDAEGADTGNEYVWVANQGTNDIILDYYSLSDSKTSMRLNGTLPAGKHLMIKPKFPLRNTNGSLYLKQNMDIIDFLAWGGIWNLKTNKNELLVRKNLSFIGENAWKIDKI